MSIAVMKQALEFIAGLGRNHWGNRRAVMDALRAAIEQAEQPKYDPIELHVLHSHIAGVLFDFMGWLTSREKRLTLSSTDEAGPAVEAITEFAKMRGLHLEDAQVEHWQAILTTPPTAPRQEQYDQTSLELCEECGWRAMIPGEGCLTCARQKAQPVAWQGVHDKTDLYYRKPVQGDVRPLYAAPRKWVELTDDEARALVNRATFGDRTNWQALVYMVDAKLKEKNA